MKTNPKKVPRTEADVIRAKMRGQEEGVEYAIYIVLYALADKSGFSEEQIQKIGRDCNYIADSINKRYINYSDIKRMIQEEYGFTWE